MPSILISSTLWRVSDCGEVEGLEMTVWTAGVTGTDLIDFSTADIESTIKAVDFTLDKASHNKQVRLFLLTVARNLLQFFRITIKQLVNRRIIVLGRR